MPIYEVEDPETGFTLELEGDSPPTEQELIEIFSTVSRDRAPAQQSSYQREEPKQPEIQSQVQQPSPVASYEAPRQEARVTSQQPVDSGDALSSMLNDVTQEIKTQPRRHGYGISSPQAPSYQYGTQRGDEMRRIKGMSSIGSAPELNEMSMAAFKTSLGLLTEGDPERAQKVIESNIPNATFRTDEKGNRIAVLPSGEYIFDSPDLDAQDVARFAFDAAAFTPAGRAATIGGSAAAAGATELATELAASEAGAGEVDIKDVALASGFGALGKGLENVLANAYRFVKGKPAQTQDELVQFAESQGVPLYTTDIAEPTTFVGKQAQSAAEKVPFAGTGAMREEQQVARSELVQDFQRRFGDYDPAEVVASLQRKTDKVMKAAGTSRQNIVNQVADVDVPTQNTIDAIDKEIARLTTSPRGEQRAVVDQQTVDTLNRYRQDLINDPSFSNYEQLRTQFRTDVKGDRAVLNNRSQAASNRIYSAMSKDMNETVEISLGADQAAKWKKANAVYGKEAEKVKNTRIKNVLQKGELTPEVVNNMLYSNKPSEVRTLFNSLDTKGKSMARAGIIAKAVEASAGSPQKFLTQLNKLEKPLGIVLKKEDRAYVQGLKKYLEATSQAAEAAVTTPTGQQLFQVAVPAGIAADVGTTGGTGAALAGTYGLLARAYESKPVRNALIRLKSVPANSDAYLQRLNEVSSVLRTLSQTQREEME